MHPRAIDSKFAQMNAYFLVMNSKRCIKCNVFFFGINYFVVDAILNTYYHIAVTKNLIIILLTLIILLLTTMPIYIIIRKIFICKILR